MVDTKRADFDRMWNTDNVAKRTQFRNYMKAKLDQIHQPVTEENARSYWMGELKAAPPREEYRQAGSGLGDAAVIQSPA